DTATAEIYTLSLHDALPISRKARKAKAAKLPRAKKAASKPLPSRHCNKEPLALTGRAVSFWAGLTLGSSDATVGRPRKSRHSICASPAQCRIHGRRHHRRGARLRPMAEEVPEPRRGRQDRPPPDLPGEAADLHERQRRRGSAGASLLQARPRCPHRFPRRARPRAVQGEGADRRRPCRTQWPSLNRRLFWPGV